MRFPRLLPSLLATFLTVFLVPVATSGCHACGIDSRWSEACGRCVDPADYAAYEDGCRAHEIDEAPAPPDAGEGADTGATPDGGASLDPDGGASLDAGDDAHPGPVSDANRPSDPRGARVRRA